MATPPETVAAWRSDHKGGNVKVSFMTVKPRFQEAENTCSSCSLRITLRVELVQILHIQYVTSCSQIRVAWHFIGSAKNWKLALLSLAHLLLLFPAACKFISGNDRGCNEHYINTRVNFPHFLRVHYLNPTYSPKFSRPLIFMAVDCTYPPNLLFHSWR